MISAESYATLSAADSAAYSVGKLLIISTPWTVGNLTLTSSIKVIKGGLITIVSGKTLTIRGPFEAGSYQVFAGSGSVAGLKYSESIWFGTIGNGIADDRIPMQKAFSSIADTGRLVINNGNYKIVNAIGTGLTQVLQRADAVANKSLYPLILSAQNAIVDIYGNLIETSLLDDLIRVIGDNCKVIGRGGYLKGCGSFLDTNSENILLQWKPALLYFSGDNGEVSGLLCIDPPTFAIEGFEVTGLNVHDNIIRGGATTHGSGTYLVGIGFIDASIYCKATNNLIEPSSTSGMVYSAIFNTGSHTIISNNRVVDAISHAVYNYGEYVNISNNVINASTMLFPSIQSFADNVTITGNTITNGIGGIAIKMGRNSVISDNKISNIRTTGIMYSTITDPLDVDTVSNITITNNLISFDDTSTVKQGGIDVRSSYNLNNVYISNNNVEGAAASWDWAGIVLATAAPYMVSNSIISENTIKNTDGFGILLYRVRNSSLSGNKVINADKLGATYKESIWAYNILNCFMTDNFCTTDTSTNIDYHIFLHTGCNNTTIYGNYLYPFTIAAIHSTGTIFIEPPPIYVSSIIENTTPSKLEITYNKTLANVIPDASSFTVNVNSKARTVNSVVISGTKVQLTLSTPVAYGDVVTVAYSKPSANPLQTAAGGPAASLNQQTVTNKVAAPAVPVYFGAAIENATPSKLEMTYSLSLANIVPALSAFVVQVNSVSRTVSSVTISGTKVLLTLASPVTFGDLVTVAYTKPSINPLQTSAGGQAASISAQSVTNRVAVINIAPVVVVISPQSSFSGFVNEISASGSYDANKDNLTFKWLAPVSVPLSSSSGATIRFLGPMVDEPTTVEFTVNVSDGKTTKSKVIPVEILPYKPELEVAEILNVDASSFYSTNYPHNVIDGNIGTMWSANGIDQWLIIELKELFSIQHVKLAFQPGQKKESYFDILGSDDKEIWEPILTKSASCDFTGDLQAFAFPPSKAGKEFKYVKLLGQGNSTDTWNFISELKVYGYRHPNPSFYENMAVKLYPNPARKLINIRIDEPTLSPDFIRIINLLGKVVSQNNLDPEIREFQIPLNLQNGIYIVQLGSDDLTLFTQKLVISN
jgi:uncharacterized repeat protein (TIGR02059 family)